MNKEEQTGANKTLKKVLVVSHYEKGGGNPLDSLWFSAEAIARKGIELEFVYTRDWKTKLGKLFSAPYIVFDGSSSLVYRMGKIWALAALFTRAPKAIYWHETDWYFQRWPLNLHLRGSFWKKPHLFLRYSTKFLGQRWLLKRKSLAHFHVCQYGVNMMKEKYGYANRNIWELKNITHEEPILKHPVPHDSDPHTVVSVGKVNPRKRPDIFLQVAEKVVKQYPQAKFYFLGNFEAPPYDEATMAEAIQEKGLEKHVEFVGFQKKPLDWVKKGAVFLHTAQDDPSPKVLMEALGMGKWVAAFRVSGVAEILREHGKMAPFEDVDALADAVMAGFDQNSPEAQAERRVYYLERFTTEAFAQRFENVFLAWEKSLS